jgi:hypothetical protein
MKNGSNILRSRKLAYLSGSALRTRQRIREKQGRDSNDESGSTGEQGRISGSKSKTP